MASPSSHRYRFQHQTDSSRKGVPFPRLHDMWDPPKPGPTCHSPPGIRVSTLFSHPHTLPEFTLHGENWDAPNSSRFSRSKATAAQTLNPLEAPSNGGVAAAEAAGRWWWRSSPGRRAARREDDDRAVRGADTCAALLGYTLYADMKVSEVAALFGADPRRCSPRTRSTSPPRRRQPHPPAGLRSASPPGAPAPTASQVRRRALLRAPADTLASVADVVFAGLASADQIRTANGLSAEDPDAPLDAGATLVVPLPCACFNSTDNNLPAVYLSYVVRVGDTVQSIAATHATTVTDISNVNAMGSPIVAPGDILAIPLPGKQTLRCMSPKFEYISLQLETIRWIGATFHVVFLPIWL